MNTKEQIKEILAELRKRAKPLGTLMRDRHNQDQAVLLEDVENLAKKMFKVE